MAYINWIAVIISLACSLILAYIWYGTGWIHKKGQQAAQEGGGSFDAGHTLKLTGWLVVMILVLHLQMIVAERSGITDGVKFGFMCAVGYSVTALGITGQSKGRTLQGMLLDAAFMVLAMSVSGAVIGSMMARI